MKIITLALLLFTPLANAAVPGLSSSTASGFTFGAANSQVPNTINAPLGSLSTAGIYKLCGGGTGANEFFGMYSAKGRVDSSTFPIPAGQAFHAISIEGQSAAASAGWIFSIGTSTAVLGSEGTSTAPAGRINYFSPAGGFTGWNVSYGPNVWSGLGVDLGGPSQVYLWVQSSSASAFTFCMQGTIQ
jgi:hypothetical protein